MSSAPGKGSAGVSKEAVTTAALDAWKRGYTPLPLNPRDKRPALPGWSRLDWRARAGDASVRDTIREAFAPDTVGNVGVLLGESSGGLVDVDLDHPKAVRLRDLLLPPTRARGGREGRPGTHYWYQARPGTLQPTRQYRLPDRSMLVEHRSTGAQSVIPPSIHPSGESYTWQGEPWGGEEGPNVVDGRVLAVQVAFLGFGALLLEAWPARGARHEAYLALAGGLLRYGDGVHPYWERNAPALISALAEASNDDDGPEARVKETMRSTLRRLRSGKPSTGFNHLAEIIGEDYGRQARLLLGEVESLAGLKPRDSQTIASDPMQGSGASASSAAPAAAPGEASSLSERLEQYTAHVEETADAERDPLNERIGSWQALDLLPYLRGDVRPATPSVLRRDDGQGLMYPGRLNMLFGSSESAKSWIALNAALQEMVTGSRVLYLDMEDEPTNTISRLRLLGAGDDEVRLQFAYIRPEEPLATMQRGRYGSPTSKSEEAAELFAYELERLDPTLVVVDGLTVLYGLHGLDTNDSTSTDVITGWLKSLTRDGRTTVIVIDHAPKTAEKGTMPIGSQHKVAMVQGSLIQTYPTKQPRPGFVGEVELVVLKDRPGEVRRVSVAPSGNSKAQVCAVVTIDSTTEGETTMTIASPDVRVTQTRAGSVNLSTSPEARRSELLTRRSRLVRAAFNGDLDQKMRVGELSRATGIASRALKPVLSMLIDEGYLVAVTKSGEPSPEGNTQPFYQLSVAEEGIDLDEDDPEQA